MNNATRGQLPRLILGALLFLLVAACGQDPSADERVERARDHQAQGEYRAAIIELRNALQEQSDHAAARLLLGRVYVQVEQMPSAEKELRRARELGVPLQELAVPLGIALLDRGKLDDLLEEIEPDESWPASVRASVHGLRARAHIANGDATAAREALDRADAASGGNLQADIARIDLTLAGNRAAEAASAADTATGNHPESPAVWRAAARAATAGNDAEKAEAALSRAIDLALQAAEDHLRRARLRVNRGDIDGAREDLAALGDGTQGDPRVRFVKALADWAEEDFDSACDRFQQVVSDTREFVEARFYHGVCQYRSGELNQAEAHLNWVNQRTAAPRVAHLLTTVRLELGQRELARQTIEPVLERNPDDTLALSLLSRIEMDAGNTTAAIDHLHRLAELRPEDPATQFELGRTLVSTGQLDAGQEALDEALELNPEDERVGATAVITHIQAGEYERALETARKMAEDQPDAPLPWTLQALVHLAQENEKAARKALNKAIDRAPGDPAARHYLARLEAQAGNSDAAREHYGAVLEAHEGHWQTLLALAELEARAENRAEARDLLMQAHQADQSALEPRVLLARLRMKAGEPQRALDILEQDGSIPNQPAALEVAGRAHMALDQPARAIGVLSRLVDRAPENADAHLLLTRAYARAGDSEAAVRQIERVLELEPDNAQALMLLARARVRQGRDEEARALHERLPDELRQTPLVLRNRIALAQRAGETGRAVELYRRLLEAEPASEVAAGLARALGLAGRPREALTVLQSWLDEHPGDTGNRLLLGDFHAGAGQEQEAIAAYSEVLAAEPDSVRALNNLAWLLRERQPEEAVEHAERAVELQPDSAAVRDTLGMVLLTNDRPDDAVEQLSTAVELAPDQPVLRYHYARGLVAAGRDDEAREHLRRALEAESDFEGREEAEALIDELE